MAKKRGQGEGSPYQDKHGQWWAAISIHGKRKAARCANRKAALAKIKEWQQRQDASVSLDGGAQSLERFLTTWFNESVTGNVKPRTAENYRGYCERYYIPQLGRYALDTLVANPLLIQAMLNDCRAQGLAPRTVHHLYTVLHTALERAVKWNLIMFNPVSRIDPPKVPHTRKAELTIEHCQALFAAAEGHRLATLYHVAVTLGCRLGELLGLRWIDLDWNKAELMITQQIQVVENKLTTETPKTASGVRLLPVPPLLLDRLRADWDTRQEERSVLGTGWKEHGLIFPSEKGTPKSPRNLQRDWYACKDAAKLPYETNFHMLRHTCASFAAEVGTNEAIIGALLGHASGRTITGHYTHATKAALRRCVTDIELLVLDDIQGEHRQWGS